MGGVVTFDRLRKTRNCLPGVIKLENLSDCLDVIRFIRGIYLCY